MAEDTTITPSPETAPSGGRRPRRKASAPRARRTAPRAKRSSAAKRPAARRARPTASVERLLAGFASKALAAGSGVAAGAEKARAVARRAGTLSKRTIDRLTNEWRRMDTPKKLQFVAALLAALAAASAPVVRARLKKR